MRGAELNVAKTATTRPDWVQDEMIRAGLLYRVVENGVEVWRLTPDGERAARRVQAELEKVAKK